MKDTTLPTDDYSLTLQRLIDHPQAIVSTSTIETQTFTGHSESWIVKTVRIEGSEAIFLQQIDAEGGRRFVLPAAVVAAIARQRDQVLAIVRRRGARKAAATRQVKRGNK